MNRISRRTSGFLPFALLAACNKPASKFTSYDGPPVTQIVVSKGERRMFLMSGRTVPKAHDVGLGNEPVGTKRFEGYGKTPEGVYFIDRFNPGSAYHLSLGVSYPNIRDTGYPYLLRGLATTRPNRGRSHRHQLHPDAPRRSAWP